MPFSSNFFSVLYVTELRSGNSTVFGDASGGDYVVKHQGEEGRRRRLLPPRSNLTLSDIISGAISPATLLSLGNSGHVLHIAEIAVFKGPTTLQVPPFLNFDKNFDSSLLCGRWRSTMVRRRGRYF